MLSLKRLFFCFCFFATSILVNQESLNEMQHDVVKHQTLYWNSNAIFATQLFLFFLFFVWDEPLHLPVSFLSYKVSILSLKVQEVDIPSIPCSQFQLAKVFKFILMQLTYLSSGSKKKHTTMYKKNQKCMYILSGKRI